MGRAKVGRSIGLQGISGRDSSGHSRPMGEAKDELSVRVSGAGRRGGDRRRLRLIERHSGEVWGWGSYH